MKISSDLLNLSRCCFYRRGTGTIAVVAALALVCPVRASDRTLEDAAGDFARELVAHLDPELPSWFDVRNASSLPGYRWARVRDILIQELRKSSQVWRDASSAPQKIEITFSENVSHFLWIAEISRGRDSDVVVSSVERLREQDNSNPEFPIKIEIRKVFRQEAPILDLVLLDETLFVLDPAGVSRYRRLEQEWKITGFLMLSNVSGMRQLPRDPRGRLWMEHNSSGDAFRAFLPDLTCGGTFSPPRVECRKEEDEMWPVEMGWASFLGRRNFFDGRIRASSGDSGQVPTFFSMAEVQVGDAVLWMFAGLDGNTHLFGDDLRALGTVGFWSSDLAGIRAGCGSSSQVLSVRRMDADEVSVIRAFEVLDRQPVAVSSAVEISGSITAFRSLVGRTRVLAIASYNRPKHYAAYLLSLGCRR